MSQPNLSTDALLKSMLNVVRTMHRDLAKLALDKGSLIVLGVVYEHGELRPSGVADVLGLDISTISRHIKRLEDAKLISRKPDPQDGRAALLKLTGDGTAFLDRINGLRLTALETALVGWTNEDRQTLAVLLARLNGDLAALPEPVRTDFPIPIARERAAE